jgi:hypothetical protein
MRYVERVSGDMLKAGRKPKTKFQRIVYAKVCISGEACISLALACLQCTEAADTTTYEVLIQ